MPPEANHTPRGNLPRLSPERYRGTAVVFWTHTIARRRTGWLDENFHAGFRELMMHAAAREHLVCPAYTLMPDHLHLIWMGMSPASNQRTATTFLRTRMGKMLGETKWQHQPHDHVLRKEERKRGAFAATCTYIMENPVRAGLVIAAAEWRFTGCVIPGYPDLHPLHDDFWGKFWKIYASDLAQGHTGKIQTESEAW